MTVAQLVARISVAGSAEAQGHLKAFSAAIDATGNAAARMGQRLLSLASPMNLLLGAVTGGGIVGAGIYAMKTAAEFDRLSRSIEGITGSAERASQIWQFVRRLEVPSIFDTEPLAQGAMLLESFGLKTEEFLPIAEKLASIFAPTGAGIEEVVRILGRVKGGNISEALGIGPESLSRFGLAHEAFVAMGLQFDKNNQYLGTTRDALNAIGYLTESKFGKLTAALQSSPAAKFASFMSAVHRTVIEVGAALNDRLLPALSEIGDRLLRLVESGFVSRLAQQFADLLAVAPERMPGMIATLVAGIGMIPSAFARARALIEPVFTWLVGTARLIVSIFAGLWVTTAIERTVTVLMGVVQALRMAASTAAALATIAGQAQVALLGLGAGALVYYGLGKMLGEGPKMPGEGESWGQEFGRRRRDALAAMGATDTGQLLNTMASAAQGLIGKRYGVGGFAFTGTETGSAVPNVMGEIARNTRRTADNTTPRDLRRYALGGGRLAEIGVTPVELRQHRASQQPVSVRVQGARTFEGMLTDLVTQLNAQLRAPHY